MADSVWKVSLHDHRKQRFLEWLCTIKEDREPQYQKDLALELGVHAKTLSDWRSDPEFLEEWNRRYRRTVGNPERMQRVLDQLYETATDRTDPRQVQAAKEYRLAVEGVAPTRMEVSVNTRELSDEALAELIAETAMREATTRDDV